MAHKNNVCSPLEGVASIFSDFSANEKFQPTRPVHPAAAARSVPLSLLAYFSNALLGTQQKYGSNLIPYILFKQTVNHIRRACESLFVPVSKNCLSLCWK